MVPRLSTHHIFTKKSTTSKTATSSPIHRWNHWQLWWTLSNLDSCRNRNPGGLREDVVDKLRGFFPVHMNYILILSIYIYIILYIHQSSPKKTFVYSSVFIDVWAWKVFFHPPFTGLSSARKGCNATCRRTAHLEPTKLETSQPTGGDSMRFPWIAWAKKNTWMRCFQYFFFGVCWSFGKVLFCFFLLFNVVLLVLLWAFFGISKIFMNNGKHPTSYNNNLGWLLLKMDISILIFSSPWKQGLGGSAPCGVCGLWLGTHRSSCDLPPRISWLG